MRVFILLWLFWPLQSVAETSVWKVSHGQNELFIGGTIHVLSRDDYPLPIEFERAYQQADILVLETDLAMISGVEIQRRLLQKVMYAGGRRLQDELSPEVYRQLSDYVKDTPLSMEVLSQFKPPMVMIMLTMDELQRLGMDNSGVDNYFNERALQDGKKRGELESVELQMELIADMGKGQEDEMILSTIRELKELPMMMNDMKAAWRSGNIQRLEKLVVDPMRREFPVLYESLLVSRNNSWLPKIEALLVTPEHEFVLMGALHLVAKEGVIEQLIRRGYQVERLH